MDVTRRDVLATAGGAALVLGAVDPAAASRTGEAAVSKGRLKQSVCRWCYEEIEFRTFCKGVAEVGLTAIDLLKESDWAIAKEFGLTCSMGSPGAGSIPDGVNDPANHDTIVSTLTATIPKAAEAGVPNLIVFFGNRRPNINDEQAVRNCADALSKVAKVAEDHDVTVCVELLNSKVDHEGYQGDHTPFGVEVMKAVGSPRVKLLYDIYHMQIMEGDVIRTITDNWEYIAHFHTGGVPGRHELDGTQELQWDAIARAIVDKGFTGYFAHEFIPTRDPLASLGEAVKLCDV
ncbi:MAG: TIM barrel protein [Luteitalea sp.]|nr:TIM barrel protein [Luteitalea sp.]